MGTGRSGLLRPTLTLKLERITTFKIDGREVPLCSLNGQTVNMANSMKRSPPMSSAKSANSLRHEWMASRYYPTSGRDSRRCRRAGRGEGPVAQLREKFPGSEIVVDFTGKDGDHEQFVYVVKDGEFVDRFTQGSDGALERYRHIVSRSSLLR